jgi:hypothetical protein
VPPQLGRHTPETASAAEVLSSAGPRGPCTAAEAREGGAHLLVRAGKIRWVLTGGTGGGFGRDGRTGATAAMAAVARTCTPVSTSGSSSTTAGTTSGLYDCVGRADALTSAAQS